jgi:hypothetical protein
MFHEHFLLGLDTKDLVSTIPEDRIALHVFCKNYFVREISDGITVFEISSPGS